MDVTQEKLHALQQLQITLHATKQHMEQQPMCAINNAFPFKPILQLRQPVSSPSASSSSNVASTPVVAGALLADIPLSARVDLTARDRNRFTRTDDACILSLHMTAGECERQRQTRCRRAMLDAADSCGSLD